MGMPQLVEIEKNTKTKQYRIYHDDCLARLAQIPENTFDMIFADPPHTGR